MKVREAIDQGKNVFRSTVLVAGNVTYVLSEKVDIQNGFLRLTKDDFKYQVVPMMDGKRKVASIQGDYSDKVQFINKDCVASYEELEVGSDAYNHFKDMIDRCLAAKCNIQLPPEKEIVIAQS